jgi:hypothetical protein
MSTFVDISPRRGWLTASNTNHTAVTHVISSPKDVGATGMDLAILMIIPQRKEVRNMKIATSILAAVLFTATLGVINTATGADGILSKDQLTAGSYCHEKFPAIRQSTLGDDQPMLKDSSTGDVIDFYGPCGENPVGKDQVQAQRIENEHRLETEYSD